MKKGSEKTSKKVAAKAAMILGDQSALAMLRHDFNKAVWHLSNALDSLKILDKQVKSIAGSALTQKEK